ncbi:hypothetical protein Z043_123711 [Scleropages formosus]|uniref:B30.2/SPRY domain-containing protein n=1 Tax=Scleropages formosus TaxID=113540 RepID=A0A0P7TX09_SCLFO|nr:hypothetical protein Z043_123711 [Scleropages formosus]
MLNPVTAYPFLIVSDDGKQVKRGEKTKLNISSPQRYDSAPRKGLFDMSPRIGYYAIWWSANQLRVLTSPLTKVKISSRLRRVGIYVDCEEGQVVFYNAKAGSAVYAFSGEEFSEKMLPLFGTGDKDVPLVLVTPETNIPE